VKTVFVPAIDLLVRAQMDEDSDEELEGLSGMYAQDGAMEVDDGTHRYTLLRELWASAR